MRWWCVLLLACAEPVSDVAPAPASAPAASQPARKDTQKLFAAAMAAQDPALFEQVIAQDPMSCFAYINAGALRERGKQPELALLLYQQAITLPSCPEAFAALTGYLLVHKPADALSVAKDGVAKFPNFIPLRHRNAEALIAAGRYAEAEQHALAVLKADEKNAFAMLNLSRAYFGQKKYELARLAADNARAIEPDRGEMFHQLGVLHLQRNERPQALAAFRKAVELRPELVASQINLAQLLGEAGDSDGALKAAQVAVAFAPESVKAQLALGNAYRVAQRLKEAEQVFIALPADKDAIYNLGILYLDAELPGVSLEERLSKAIATLSRLPSTPEVQGYILQARRQIDSEKKRKERELKRKPTK